MGELILDTSAVLALLNDENGGTAVAEAMERERCIIGSVNVAEVATCLADRGMPEPLIARIVLSLPITTIELDFGTACKCGALRPITRSLGLSLGDRACLALAIERRCPVLTADRIWARLDLGLDIRCIR